MGRVGRKGGDLPPTAAPMIMPKLELLWEAVLEDAVMVLPAGKVWVTCTTEV